MTSYGQVAVGVKIREAHTRYARGRGQLFEPALTRSHSSLPLKPRLPAYYRTAPTYSLPLPLNLSTA